MDVKAALADIDQVLDWARHAQSDAGRLARCLACVARYAPQGSSYRIDADKYGMLYPGPPVFPEAQVQAVLAALREDVSSGRLLQFEERVHADVYGDLLTQAEGLHSDGGFHRAATVLAGAALEEHIRLLALKHNTGTTMPDGSPKKASVMNADLKKAGIYTETQRAIVEGWQKLRNDAAHGKPGFEPPNIQHAASVAPMITGIRGFILQYPA